MGIDLAPPLTELFQGRFKKLNIYPDLQNIPRVMEMLAFQG
jgi:hypothetical protein